MLPRKDMLVYAALLAACALVVVLSVQQRNLRAEYDALALAGLEPQIGSWIPTAAGSTATGETLLLGQASQRRQVLYFFDPECAQCEVTAPAIRTVAQALKRGDYPATEIYGIGTGLGRVIPEYARSHGFDFPVAYSTSKIRTLFSVSVVPLVIVVDNDSRVLYSHAGKLDTKEEVASLMSALRIQEGKATGQSK